MVDPQGRARGRRGRAGSARCASSARRPEPSCRPTTSTDLGSIKQRSGKVVHAWAAEGDLDAGAVRSNTFTMEWPPRSGTMREFPEVDRAAWFPLAEARERINPAQAEFLDRLA